MLYTIYRIGHGWYSFANIPQGYVKIDGLNCGSDEKAMAMGQKMLKNIDSDIAKNSLCFEDKK